MCRTALFLLCCSLLSILLLPRPLHALSAQELIEETWNQLRGQASRGEVAMTIHRPDWERTMRMQTWTQGRSQSLIRILEPAKDKGNGTLKKGQDMRFTAQPCLTSHRL